MAVAKSYAGGTTAAASLTANPCTIQALALNAAATSVLTLWDNNAGTATGNILYQATFAAAFNGVVDFTNIGGIKAAAGIAITVATATCQTTAIVF